MNGSIWVLLVATAVYATSLLMHRFVDSKWTIVRLPITWFYFSWILGLALLSLPVFKYFEAFSYHSGAFLVAILFAFSIGSVTAAFWQRRARNTARYGPVAPPSVSTASISTKLIASLLILGLIGTALLLLNSILGGALSLADRLDSENLAAIRIEQMTGGESRIGPMYGPANLMSSIGGLGVAFAFYLWGSRTPVTLQIKWIRRIALLLVAVNMLIGIIGFGSRMFSVFAALVALLAFAEGRWAIGERLIAKSLNFKEFLLICFITVATLVALWAAATVFLEKRVQRQDAQSLLYRTHRATLDPFTYGITRGDVASQYLMFSFSYLTTPIPTLAFYLELPSSRQPGPFFGEYNFPAIGRWGRRLTFLGDPFAWEMARYEIFKPLGDIGFGTNVWSTLVRDLIADFTKTGALVFISLLGFLSQRTYDSQNFDPTVRKAGLLVYLRLLLAFTGLVSILYLPQIYWPMYLALFLAARSNAGLPKRSTYGTIKLNQ